MLIHLTGSQVLQSNTKVGLCAVITEAGLCSEGDEQHGFSSVFRCSGLGDVIPITCCDANCTNLAFYTNHSRPTNISTAAPFDLCNLFTLKLHLNLFSSLIWPPGGTAGHSCKAQYHSMFGNWQWQDFHWRDADKRTGTPGQGAFP